jgi:alkanesulfonate monooxygenase SsuD/methylene tetrahydromethanopterin reductase-like flavin-dependent oxidoreductase (luciferase family)
MRSGKPFHLGLFGNFSGGGWNGREAAPDSLDWANGEWHVTMAQALERAGFDDVLLPAVHVGPDHGHLVAPHRRTGRVEHRDLV